MSNQENAWHGYAAAYGPSPHSMPKWMMLTWKTTTQRGEAAAAGNDPMRLIRLYAARACFRASTWLAMLGKWLAGV
jgi:hypothetical protein